jgi:type IV pilus assembly protein PilN
MPRINLLPVKAEHRRHSARAELLGVAGLLGVISLVLFIFHLADESSVGDLEHQLGELNAEIDRFGKEAQEVETLKAAADKVRTKIGVIESLETGRAGPVLMLDDLATILSFEAKRVWLTSLTHRGGELELQGGAVEHEEVFEFQLALQRRPAFKAVQLLRVSGDRNVVNWQIRCTAEYAKAGGT